MNIPSTDTYFFSDRTSFNWPYAYKKYFIHENSYRYSKSVGLKPSLSSPIIVIPCHVGGCHWVAVVRRIINNTVTFLYADDLNSSSTYDSI